ASSRWPVQGPRAVLVAAVTLALTLLPPIRRVRRWGRSAIAMTAAALAVSLAFTTQTVVAVTNAGGSVNPLRALVFSSMGAKPDAVEAYAEGLRAVVYRPAADHAP